MQLNAHLCAVLVSLVALSSVSGQSDERSKETDAKTVTTQSTAASGEKDESLEQSTPSIWLHLVGGRRMQVDDVSEAGDGVWYKLGNVTTFIDRSRVERVERSTDPRLAPLSDRFEGSGRWTISDSARVQSFFTTRFNRSLPLTAFGQSELHTRWGLDHRRSMDVGLHPDSVEGKALIKFLLGEGIPFLAFRSSVPGVATGPHIHIGHGSPRLLR